MASAKTTEMPTVATITAGQPGWPISTIVNAPTMISSPWAKLIRPMIPKMSPIPSAYRAYCDPKVTASMTCWRKTVTALDPQVRGREVLHPQDLLLRARVRDAPRAKDVRAVGELD